MHEDAILGAQKPMPQGRTFVKMKLQRGPAPGWILAATSAGAAEVQPFELLSGMQETGGERQQFQHLGRGDPRLFRRTAAGARTGNSNGNGSQPGDDAPANLARDQIERPHRATAMALDESGRRCRTRSRPPRRKERFPRDPATSGQGLIVPEQLPDGPVADGSLQTKKGRIQACRGQTAPAGVRTNLPPNIESIVVAADPFNHPILPSQAPPWKTPWTAGQWVNHSVFAPPPYLTMVTVQRASPTT
jgi:hypothetical protein